MVWKLRPEQKFKVKSWLFQKSRADNFSDQKSKTGANTVGKEEIASNEISWRFIVAILKKFRWKCRRSCAHKKLMMNGQ